MDGNRRLDIARLCLVGLTVSALLQTGGCTDHPQVVTEPTAPHLQHLWPGPDGPGGERTGCTLAGGPALPGGAFTVAVTDSVRPRQAPIPGNAAERLVFAQLYETLVTADCQGQPQPGLAAAWTCTADSTVWTFTLRPGARFWDGSPVTAADVLAAWTDAWQRTPAPTAPWAWLGTQSGSIQAPATETLTIRLRDAQPGFPLLLAHPAAAVAVRRPGWTWPVGSGPCRLRASTPSPLPDLTCRPNSHHPRRPTWKELTFLVQPGRDVRDLVAGESNLLMVDNLRDVAFYDAAPGFRTLPLPWSRLYVLVCPPQDIPAGGGPWQQAAVRLDLPADLTDVDTVSWPFLALPGHAAKAADLPTCPQLAGPTSDATAAPLDWQLADQRLDQDVVIYPADETGARELAERLAALAGPRARTAPLSRASFVCALQWQMPGACVLPLDQRYPGYCLQLGLLLGQASWLQEAALARPQPSGGDSLAAAERWSAYDRGPAPEAAARNLIAAGLARPLALTRSYLVLRGDLAGIRLAFDGTPLLDGLGRAADGGPLP